MSNYKEKFESFLSDVDQMEQDNKKLNDDILALEKEKREGYKTFNTETHILVSREALSKLKNMADEVESQSDYARDESGSLESLASEVYSQCGYVKEEARDFKRKIDDIFSEFDTEEEEEESEVA
tara:strand:+ start:471 stop:845 length:375 start_codon:yes stop_codon:yes gene_type:complete